jgi:hypothetical protein
LRMRWRISSNETGTLDPSRLITYRCSSIFIILYAFYNKIRFRRIRMLGRFTQSLQDLSAAALPKLRDRAATVAGIEVPSAPGSAPEDPQSGLAEYLINKSGIPLIYRRELKPYVLAGIKSGKSQPNPHSDDKLLLLAKHTCTKDWVKRAFEEFAERPKEIQDGTRSGFFSGIGIVLGEGFDKVEGSKFIKDPTGKITGINDARQPVCNAALAAGETLYGGKRRKTIKKTHSKKRKTLRRRKMGRKMH